MKHKELTYKIIGCFLRCVQRTGTRIFRIRVPESLAIALHDSGLEVRSEVKIPVWFHGQRVGQFEGDLLVNNLILLELKVARLLDRSHNAQLLNYLRATDIEVGLLLNLA